MARRGNQDKFDDMFLGLLLSLPWWVPFVLAALFYGLLYRLTLLGAFMWACILVFAGLVIPFIKWRRNELITSATDLPAIRQMSWQNFEWLVGEAFRRQGYIVIERGGAAADSGIDLILHKRSEKIIVQCKQWRTQQVGVSPVRELRGVVAREKATRGIFVTSGNYTREALAEVVGQPLDLIDGPKLLKLVQDVQTKAIESQQKASNAKPVDSSVVIAKEAQIVSGINEQLCPDCGSPMVIRMARKGPNAGHEFWGCSQYPHCKGIRPI